MRIERIPKLIASSVVRGAQPGDSHGGVFVIDVEGGSVERKLDWNRSDIDTQGRGGDRGLRGIDFHQGRILIAASTAVYMFDQDFNCLEVIGNRYLLHCHEISVHGSMLCIAATGYDSVLVYDLTAKRLVEGYHLAWEGRGLRLRSFDPETGNGPQPGRRFHINSVKCSAAGIYFSGLHTPGLLHTNGRQLSMIARLPQGTHNAQAVGGGLLYNDTAADRVCYRVGEATMQMSVPTFERRAILNIDRCESRVARAGFARGLCNVAPGYIAAGSSPSTVAIYELGSGNRIALQNVSMDVHNAIHGLAVWPF